MHFVTVLVSLRYEYGVLERNDKPQRGSLEAAKPESNKCDLYS